MRKFDRRSFLVGSLGGGIAVALAAAARAETSASPATPAQPLITTPPPHGLGAEAERVTAAVMHTFWDTDAAMFRAPVMSAEAIPSDHEHDRGYVLWPSLLGLHALVEGAKEDPKRYAPQVWTVYSGLEKYFNQSMHAYNAWITFPGNNDAYYDDNAWVVIILTEAYLATKGVDPEHARIYCDRATDVLNHFMAAGWDGSGHPGGERWGTDPTKSGTGDRTTSATAGAAVGALLQASVGSDAEHNIAWAAAMLDWIWSRLRDKDNLIRDGLQAPNWKLMPTKWTYNTGVTMRGYVEHYRLTHERASLNKAEMLARAALDHRSRLYDGLVHDPAKRCYYDHSYFVHYLLDGLLQVRQATTNRALAAAITAEVRREAGYAYHYIRDDSDGLYWRNWRLWCIGPAQLATWERFTGQTTTLQTDATERSNDGKQWVKTLLGNGGAARVFWMASRV